MEGKYIILKLELVKFENALPKVVVGSGVMVGVGVIVMYGGESALTIPTMLSAHSIEIKYFFKSNIFSPAIPSIVGSYPRSLRPQAYNNKYFT